ncbi:uncharacterized protein LOC116289501 [Actinia tenebrosa]|uniref:Uncharacterized protein LOC116289501 n=1 Tax=Actinia tenebrosa TaxID=6105 RepID=A0A6P8H9T3_ACTTE|nr:uncharacterized protein LOC116289501 [Actinia tenebrosa]
MSGGETSDILENKRADHVTGDEVEKKEDRVSVEKDELPDEIKESQDEGSLTASELKAEPSEKCVSHELQLEPEAHSMDHVEKHDDQLAKSSKDQGQVHDNIQTQAEVVQNQPPPPPSEENLSSSPNKLCADSSDHKDNETKEEHNKVHSRMTAESFTDTYDVISRKEVQNLNKWESIHQDCLSEIPPIDPGALQDIERKAKEVASNLDHLLHTLNNSLKSMSVVGVQGTDTYKSTVENAEVTVDASIKSMHALIAKCEELHSYMGPLYSMSAQIKDIKRTLDVFESVCK